MENGELHHYKIFIKKFNSMSFVDKIKAVIERKTILTLASDGNWWGVKFKDDEIQSKLEEIEWELEIEREWGSSEMCDLIALLGIDNTDI